MFINLASLLFPCNEGRRMKRLGMQLIVALLFTAFSVSGPAALCDQTDPGLEPPSPRTERPGGVAERILSFYRDHISAVDGNRCPSYPSCSAYSAQAFKKHGLVMGWLMTVDRLIHEGREEAAVSPRVRSDGTWKIYDPVENNDFWWHHPEGRGHEKD